MYINIINIVTLNFKNIISIIIIIIITDTIIGFINDMMDICIILINIIIYMEGIIVDRIGSIIIGINIEEAGILDLTDSINNLDIRGFKDIIDDLTDSINNLNIKDREDTIDVDVATDSIESVDVIRDDAIDNITYSIRIINIKNNIKNIREDIMDIIIQIL